MLSHRVCLGYATALFGVMGALLNNLWLLAAVANEVSKSELGLYLLIVATIGYFALIQLGMDAASAQRITEALARDEQEHAARVYGQLKYFNARICAFIFALTIFGTAVAWCLITEELRDIACWIVAATGFGIAIQTYSNSDRAAITGSGDVHIVGIVNLFISLLTPVLGYALLTLNVGVLCLPISQVVGALFALVLLYSQRLQKCPWTLVEVAERWLGFNSMFRFGLGITASAGFAMIVATCEPVIFRFMSSSPLQDIAVYHIWFRFPAMTFVLSMGLICNAGPALAAAFARSDAEGILLFRRIFWMVTAIGAIGTFAIVSWLNPVVHHWLSGKYDLPNGNFVALGFGSLVGINALLYSVASVFYPLNSLRSVMSGYAVQAFTKILLGVCLVPFFSVYGMVWAYAGSTLLAFLWLISLLIKRKILTLNSAVGSLGILVMTTLAATLLAQYTIHLDLAKTVTGISVTAAILLSVAFLMFIIANVLTNRQES